MYEDYLMHYGVKGMKWGVRKKREKISDLSDVELQKRINRKNLENQYKNLTKKKTPKALKAVGSIGTAVIIAPATAAAAATIKKFYTQQFNKVVPLAYDKIKDIPNIVKTLKMYDEFKNLLVSEINSKWG